MNNDNWIKGTLAFFIVLAFFGGFYIGASDMRISFEMDDNTMLAISSLNETVNSISKTQECYYEAQEFWYWFNAQPDDSYTTPSIWLDWFHKWEQKQDHGFIIGQEEDY